MVNVQNVNASSKLYYPNDGQLKKVAAQGIGVTQDPRASLVQQNITQLFSQRNYPCVAALQSFATNDYRVGLYGKFGSGDSWNSLRNDLFYFCGDQLKSKSNFLSFWAVFEEQSFDEDEFENAMWKELSFLTSLEDQKTDWTDPSTANHEDKAFRFSLGGFEFFVVGLHNNSGRKSRRFFTPTLIFNLSEQFEELDRAGLYAPMVRVNRKRDIAFQGDANPRL